MSREVALAFADGASLCTDEIDLKSTDKLVGLMFEAGYNTTNCTFEAYDQDDNEYSVNDLTGAELELTISQTVDGFYPVDPDIFRGINRLKVRRGTQASPYISGVENTNIKVVLRTL